MVELGCGVGLPSLVCAAMGARVVATDLPKALEVRRKRLFEDIQIEYLYYITLYYISRKHGEGSSAKTLALLHKLDT